MKIAATVMEQMKALGITRADLARRLGGKVKQSTLYSFFKGAPLNAVALGHVFDAVGLKLSASDDGDFKRQVKVLKRMREEVDAAAAKAYNYYGIIYRRARRLSLQYVGKMWHFENTGKMKEWKEFKRLFDQGNPRSVKRASRRFNRFTNDERSTMSDIAANLFEGECPICGRKIKAK
jgi:maltooligosyltrehalose synthase